MLTSPIPVLGNHSFVRAVIGVNVSLFLKADGSAWACGNSPVGDGTVNVYSSPVSVVGSHSFIDIAIANSVRYALKADGTLWAWGNSITGRTGSVANALVPTQMPGSASLSQIGPGIMRDSNGKAYVTGNPLNGGTIVPTTYSSPVAVVGFRCGGLSTHNLFPYKNRVPGSIMV